MKLIYVAEDDEGIREVYECAFASGGYEMVGFESAEELMEKLKSRTPDLIVLDIMLSNMDGLTALENLKADNSPYKKIPVIMISARSEEHIKVKGLTVGAEDFMTKPFGIMELIARVNNILKRSDNNSTENLTYKELTLDFKKHRIYINDNRLELSPKQYNIVRILLMRLGEVVERDTLLNEVWGDGFFGETRTLDIHINGIRQEIAKYTDYKYIETVRGVGFVIGD